MKNSFAIIFSVAIATFLFLIGQNDVDALSYNGSAVFSAPVIYTTGWSILVSPDFSYDNGADRPMYRLPYNPSNYIVPQGSLGCVKIWTWTNDWVIYQDFIRKNEYTSTNDFTQYSGISISLRSDVWSGQVKVDSTIYEAWVLVESGSLFWYDRFSVTPWLAPTDLVICLSSRYNVAIPPISRVFLQSWKWAVFISENWKSYFWDNDYTSENGWAWKIMSRNTFGWYISTHPSNVPKWPIAWGTTMWYYPWSGDSDFPSRDFLLLRAWSTWINTYASTYFWATDSVYFWSGYVDPWFSTGSTGTWGTSIDYFADCTSFLDVWCYIQAFYHSIKDSIYSFFASIFPSVSFSGSSSTCASGATSWFWSWIVSVPYFQKVLNMFSLIIPFPPAEWEYYCSYSNAYSPMTYRRQSNWLVFWASNTNIPDSPNWFDLFIILILSIASFGYIYSLSHIKHD